MVTIDRIEIKRPDIKEQLAEFCKDFPVVIPNGQHGEQGKKEQIFNHRGHIVFSNGLRTQVPPGVIKADH